MVDQGGATDTSSPSTPRECECIVQKMEGAKASARRKLTQKLPVVTAEGVRVHRTLILVDGRASTVRRGGTFGDGDVAMQVLMRVVYPIGVEVHDRVLIQKREQARSNKLFFQFYVFVPCCFS